MKNVRINIGKIGVVTKNGDISKVLTAGKYWLKFNETLTFFNLNEDFTNRDFINQMTLMGIADQYLNVITVLNGQMTFVFENGLFKTLLQSGAYAFWKQENKLEFKTVDLENLEIGNQVSMSILRTKEVAPFVRFIEVESFEKGLFFVNGTYRGELNAGTYYFWKTADILSVKKADLRQQQMEINGQEILTKDKATLRINYNLRFSIVNAYRALVEVKDFEKQIYALGQLALREFIGSMTLDELLARKETVNGFVLDSITADAAQMGVEVQTSGIKDIILAGEMKEIMNQVLIAEKKAQANIIMRREETASTRSLLNTAKLMEENAMLLKLKEMEYVEKIAERIDNISISGGAKVIDQMRQLFGT